MARPEPRAAQADPVAAEDCCSATAARAELVEPAATGAQEPSGGRAETAEGSAPTMGLHPPAEGQAETPATAAAGAPAAREVRVAAADRAGPAARADCWALAAAAAPEVRPAPVPTVLLAAAAARVAASEAATAAAWR